MSSCFNQRDKAIEDYTMAIRNDRNQSQAYFNRSGLFQAQGNFEAALKDLNKVMQMRNLLIIIFSMYI